jgi:YidC/Oxa1 family membrane protein insertase
VSIQFAAWLASAASTTSTTAASAHKAGASILDPIAKPIAWVLAGIYSVIPNYAIAIIVLSVLWMLIIAPLTLKTTRSMLAMQQLQPELKKLQEKHKDDRQAFAQAQMDLFREHNVSPFGSCLPMLLPLPIFFGLYRVITGLSHTVNGVSMPKYLSPHTQMYKDIVAAGGHLKAFGMDLSLNAFSHHPSVWAALPYWILVLVLAGTGYLQSAQMMSRNPNAAANPQMRLMKYLPLVLVVLFVRFPAGVLLYYAMSNICRIVQQDAMYRFDPKVKALVVQEVREVEAHTHEIDEDRAGRGKKPANPPSDTAPPGGNQNRSGATTSPTGGASGASTGRRRFRELLAAAAEQQQKRAAPAKPARTGSGSDARPSGDGRGSAATSGSKAGGGGAATSGKDAGSGNDDVRSDSDAPATPAPSPAQPPLASGGKSTPVSSNGGDGSRRSSNGKPAGSPQGRTGRPPPKGGHRTNRKRKR